MQAREKDNRRDWIIVLLILLLGLLCIILAGGWALRITPSWKLDSNMESNLDPVSDFLTARSNGVIEPIDFSILTQPAWMDLYLTPGASFQTGTPVPTTAQNTPPPPPTRTFIPTSTPIVPPTRTATPGIIITPTNTSVINPPTRTRTPVPSNTPIVSADLSITLTDGSATYTVGGTLTYIITVRNATGPSAATGATVTDTFPAALSGITWTCTGAAGGTCPANGSGNINATVNLPVGATLTFTVNATVSPAAIGNLVNTASVTPPGTVSDPALANNTATDTDTPISNADLRITKADGILTYTPGTSTTYTIVVNNVGPANVTGATVTDTLPAQISGATWSCVAAGGATCTANGTGNINQTVNIPSGGNLTYTVVATIASSATGNLVNVASVAPPVGVTDLAMANNSATDTDTPLLNVDLRITKTDGVATYTPGLSTTYTIVVTNAGPSDAVGATVTDTFPAAQVTGVTWSCASAGGATCTANGTGNINDTVNVPVGGTLTYTAIVNISSAAIGNLLNTATVTAPVGYTDTALGNNSAADSDVRAQSADLQIVKTSPATTYAASGTVIYSIVVTNAGPSDITGATVTDAFPAQITGTTWNCTSAGGATCTPTSAGNLNDTVNLPAGGTLTYDVTATVSVLATGNLVNTATVTGPVGSDPNPANNASTYTHIPYIDVQITKDDGSLTYTAGGTVTYTVTVTNNSTFAVNNITVNDAIPAIVDTWGWCVAPCVPLANLNGNLSNTINLPAGASATYTILANINAFAAGDLVNTATITVPAAYADAVPGNNSATDTDVNQSGEPDVGPPDGNVYPIPDGGSVTFRLNQPIVANGDAAPDFVYYELAIPPNIFLDQVIIEISTDGVVWRPVFYWGDNAADTNTNVSLTLPNILTACPTEVDNCVIPTTELYNTSGITIDVDNSPLSVVPPGNYYWIRFTEPGLTPGDGTHVDSIEILP